MPVSRYRAFRTEHVPAGPPEFRGTAPLDAPVRKDRAKCWFCPRPAEHRGYCDPCYREILRGIVVPVKRTVAAYTRFVYPPGGQDGPIREVRIPAHTRMVPMRTGGSGFLPWKPSEEDRGPCSTRGCSGRIRWLDLCRKCYYRRRRRGPGADISADGRFGARG